LAIDDGYGLVQSLAVARVQLAAETRRAALATHIEAKIRARHEHDPILASIAATTTPIDDVAQELMTMIDARGWALAINEQIHPPAQVAALGGRDAHAVPFENDRTDRVESPRNGVDETQLDGSPTGLTPLVPTNPAVYERWRALWTTISQKPDATNKQLAADLATSVRTVQRIRVVGAAGLL
jgi:hypothetical protein